MPGMFGLTAIKARSARRQFGSQPVAEGGDETADINACWASAARWRWIGNSIAAIALSWANFVIRHM